jgi:predicted transposase YdaD
MDLRYNDIYLKGLAQGKKEAKERWTIKIISNCLKQNLSLADIASLTEISVEEVKQYIKDNHLDEK